MDELDQAAQLLDAYRGFYGLVSDRAGAAAFLSERIAQGDSMVLLAFATAEEREAAGIAQLYPSFSSLALGRIVVLNDLYVAPRWRRRGVARALVDAAVAYAGRLGAERLELSTQHTNAAALRLYRSLGWVVDQEFAHLELPLRRHPARSTADTVERRA
jgi:ribosomal protein S18 acetylase RimI-like enzyme